jgi:NAD(P)-dependent dehydrogenase (short-subunit alcohol dehydrogenase family)
MVVLVTGTSSGLGCSLVKQFKKLGHKTIGVSKSKSPETDHVCNLLFENDINKTFKNIIANNDRIDYLILNAGILGKIKKAKYITNTELNNVFKVNLFSNKLILDLVLNSQIQIKNVIFISSGASLKAYDGWLSYCLTKASLNQLSKCYAIENKEIKFISLAPGIIQTKMQDEIIANSEDSFTSISKFKDLYGKNPSPDFIANKIVNNLEIINNIKSGEYFDLRTIDD